MGVFAVHAQQGSLKATSTSKAASMVEVPALSKMDNIISAKGLAHDAPPKRRGSNKVVAGKGFPKGPDPLVKSQNNAQRIAARAPTVDFPAHTGRVLNDPTGAIGPNHYVYAFNSGFGILDRSGNVLVPEASLATLFPNEDLGDPVVVYDRYADRFIIMQFSDTPNGILIAVCKGPDPVNDGWYTYRFNTGSFPDYEKMSVWSDGYYITANKNSGNPTNNDVVFALERDEMLVGNPNAKMVGFPLPDAETNGFYSPGGFNCIGSNLPPVGTPQPIVYMQDDSWSGISQDHLKIWNVSVDWNIPSNSSITAPQIINTTPFDSVFDNGSFNNLDEPGSGPDIDALQATMMYMTNYRRFDSYNAVVMNFAIDVSGNDSKAGIRWYELRQTADGQPWTIYQEGTYSQPNHSTFCGSISMDVEGNIGLAYTIVSTSIFTSLRYTGRLASDPLGVMTVAEQTIVDGDVKNNRSDGRYGDYAQLTVDPLDDMTFWHIGEYMKGPGNQVRKSHVAAFKIATGPPDTEAPTTPTNLEASNTTATTTDLSWNASTDNIAVSGYDIYQDGTLIATVSGTNYTVTGLSPLTSYNFYVVAKDNGGNTSGNSNTVTVETLEAQVTYCDSASTNINDEFIGRVELNTIDNSSGGQFYSDFTSISTTLNKDTEYTITVTPTWPGTTYSEGYAVWIDYNQDGDFTDSGEQVWTQAPTTNTPVSGSFTIPNTASNGATRMRVSLKYNAIPTSCETFTYGEVEDYTVIIEDNTGEPTCSDGIQNGDEEGIDCGGSTCDPCTSDSIVIHEGFFETGWDNWIDGGSDSFRYEGPRSYEGSYSIRLRDDTNSSKMTSESFDLSEFESVSVEFFFFPNSMENNEDFWLQYNDGSGWETAATWASGSEFENNSFYTSTVVFNSSDYNLSANARFRFRCDASGNGDRIYIDAVTITGNSTTNRSPNTTRRIDKEIPQQPIITNELSTEENDFLIYPNPTQSILNINNVSGLKVDTIKVFSAFGLLVKEIKGVENYTSINVSNYASGTYFIRFVSGDTIVTKRFIKK